MEFNFIFNFDFDNWVTSTVTVIAAVAAVIGAYYARRLFYLSKPFGWIERVKNGDHVTKVRACLRHGLPNSIVLIGPVIKNEVVKPPTKVLEPGKTVKYIVAVPPGKESSAKAIVKHKLGDEYWLHVDW